MHSPRLVIKQIELGPMANYVYLVGCSATREAAAVDPAWDVPAIIDLARESDLNIKSILVTHAHPDHINGLEELLGTTDARIYMNREEVPFALMAAEFFGSRIDWIRPGSANFQAVADGDEMQVGKLAVRILHTPGHTPGSQCFLLEESLISGDTLFINQCGRVDLPGSDPEKMWWSLNHKLSALADETVLYPGHNYSSSATSTIGREKLHNPYMKCATLRQFLGTPD